MANSTNETAACPALAVPCASAVREKKSAPFERICWGTIVNFPGPRSQYYRQRIDRGPLVAYSFLPFGSTLFCALLYLPWHLPRFATFMALICLRLSNSTRIGSLHKYHSFDDVVYPLCHLYFLPPLGVYVRTGVGYGRHPRPALGRLRRKSD
ncbi:hypothetical protein H4582DRAFT_660398 [Lactarius indigo]|nr:hypothetical protein H4582DRAFT_660398 [Lactarius indigo]